jgi:hypothetical protein
MRRVNLRTGAAAAVLALLVGAGCRPPGTERFVPPAAAARQALEVALRAWQDGRTDPKIDTVSPPVMVADTVRRPGQRLTGYDVLGELPGDGPRQFVVRLRLDNPPEEQKVRFVVFGIQPVWVYRLEDYEMLAHWECGMTTEKTPDAAPADTKPDRAEPPRGHP